MLLRGASDRELVLFADFKGAVAFSQTLADPEGQRPDIFTQEEVNILVKNDAGRRQRCGQRDVIHVFARLEIREHVGWLSFVDRLVRLERIRVFEEANGLWNG